jgi:hypothetical protein
MNQPAKKILFLSTYPIKNPRHGGQIRLANIIKVFQKDGWETHHVAICDQDAYDEAKIGGHDIIFPKSSSYRLYKNNKVPFISDLTSGYFASEEALVIKKALKEMPKDLDVIHVEQPWLFAFAKKLRSQNAHKTKLVYGSANIESGLKAEIFKMFGLVDTLGIIDEIQNIEMTATKEADLVLAVSHQESETFQDWGAQEVAIALNGATLPDATPEKRKEWMVKLPKNPFALYVASAHPPNFTGWLELLGPALGYIPPGSKLVVAGSVCEHIYQILNNSNYASLNMPKLQLLFELDDSDLSAVKSLADLFLIPLKTGFGTNLKTAEALISKKTVVSSVKGMRGYEEFKSLPQVTVSDEKEILHGAIRRGLSPESAMKIPTEKRNQPDPVKLAWDHCLGKLPSLYASIR